MASFASCSASGPPRPISSASAMAAASAVLFGPAPSPPPPPPQYRSRRPMSRASLPATRRPVKMRSLARATPTSRGSRCVPPAPGMIARRVSGKPTTAADRIGPKQEQSRKPGQILRAKGVKAIVVDSEGTLTLVAADPEVAGHGQFEAAAEREAAHRRDRRDGQPLDGEEGVPQPRHEGQRLLLRHALALLQVRTRAEDRRRLLLGLRRVHHEAAHARGVLGAQGRQLARAQLQIRQERAPDGVPLRRPVQLEPRHRGPRAGLARHVQVHLPVSAPKSHLARRRGGRGGRGRERAGGMAARAAPPPGHEAAARRSHRPHQLLLLRHPSSLRSRALPVSLAVSLAVRVGE
mmetsp:Transcript_7192/g.17735  ORF Transcript_7192/g.17735 Transcript_7192/m.17735 type:complete len:350 (+) Transcript_7192:252-1301(+)